MLDVTSRSVCEPSGSDADEIVGLSNIGEMKVALPEGEPDEDDEFRARRLGVVRVDTGDMPICSLMDCD